MSDAATTIVLDQRLELANVKALHAELLRTLKGSSALVVDASRVEVIDSGSAQVLVAFAQAAFDARVPVRWSCSPAFDAFFTLTALKDALDSPPHP